MIFINNLYDAYDIVCHIPGFLPQISKAISILVHFSNLQTLLAL